MKVYFNKDYTSCKHAFDTTRKSALIAEKAQAVAQIECPKPFYKQTERLLKKTHTSQYVQAVKTGEPSWQATSQGFAWDKKIYRMALAHNAGVVAATSDALNGVTAVTLSSGLHHARADHGSGFCTFNGLAVATNYALECGADRIAIIDFDAHGGGGTYSLVGGRVTHIDIVVSDFDSYDIPDEDTQSRLVHSRAKDDEYLLHVDRLLDHLARLPKQDIFIYNAGMDPANSGISPEALAQRENLMALFVEDQNVAAAVTMAGGYSGRAYTMDDIADLHMMTVNAFSKVPTTV